MALVATYLQFVLGVSLVPDLCTVNEMTELLQGTSNLQESMHPFFRGTFCYMIKKIDASDPSTRILLGLREKYSPTRLSILFDWMRVPLRTC